MKIWEQNVCFAHLVNKQKSLNTCGDYYYEQVKELYPVRNEDFQWGKKSAWWRLAAEKISNWVYLSWAAGGNSHHRTADGDIDARTEPRQKTGTIDRL